MKKTFRIIVAEVAAMFFGMAALAVQAQWGGGPYAVPTDRGGTPIYANQEGYFGAASGGCASGNCGNHAVGPNVTGFVGGPVGMGDCGCGGAPCEAPCGAPCGEVCGPCFAGPCLPCLPCLGGCGPCGAGGGVLSRIWNGPNYWQGPGCSERVIDELRKSWQACPRCDLMGENVNGTGNTIGTGLRSSQIVSAGAPYGPIKMNAGQPENGLYSVPVNRSPAPFQPGGCSSCKKGVTVTQAQPQNAQPVQTYAQPVQTYAQPVQTYAQPTPTYAQPAQTYAQPVQYEEPIQKSVPQRRSYRTSGPIRYRTNYTPSSEVPGYIRAQQNAEQKGIGFADIPKTNAQPSAFSGNATVPVSNQGWTVVPVSHEVPGQVIPVDYQQESGMMETVATPAPRVTGSVLSAAPGMEGASAYPAVGAPMAYPGGDCGASCGAPCGPVCDPCGPVCDSCGPCGFGCGPYGGAWPGLIPLAADAVRFTGRAVFNTGRAAVIGTGLVARGGVRTIGFVLWNRPLPAGPMMAGEMVAPAPVMDPVYAQNDYYLNASYQNPNAAGQSVSTLPPASNLYENHYYPQNYVVTSDTAVSGTGIPSSVEAQFTGNATGQTVGVNGSSNVASGTAPGTASGTANLLSYQTQRVYLDDGTEVILEHDAMMPQNRSMNASVQYMASNDSAAPALRSAVPAMAVGQNAGQNAGQTQMSQVSYGSVQAVPGTVSGTVSTAAPMQEIPLENAPVANYPIIAAEKPQIQLAPGEVLVSQEDFILLPPESAPTAPAVPVVPVVPASGAPQGELDLVPAQTPGQNGNSGSETTVPTSAPVRDANVTRVSYQEPAVVSRQTTDSGWQILTREDAAWAPSSELVTSVSRESSRPSSVPAQTSGWQAAPSGEMETPSLLNLKPASPIQ